MQLSEQWVLVTGGARGLGQAITRDLDQPGQGHFFRFDRDTRALAHGWRPLEDLQI